MISIIVPVYNEKDNILKFQENLKQLDGDFEVIFSDGFSTDDTYDLIEFNKIRETKYRSNQMNAAAKYAGGDILWFLHADSVIDKNSLCAIENANAEVGCFKLKFDTNNLYLKFLAYCSNLRVNYRNIAFGDQGIFITRKLFDELGGYKEIPIMEDYELSIMVKKRGIKIRQLNLSIMTSPRRFTENGILKTNIMMQKLQTRYRKMRRKSEFNMNQIYEIYESGKK